MSSSGSSGTGSGSHDSSAPRPTAADGTRAIHRRRWIAGLGLLAIAGISLIVLPVLLGSSEAQVSNRRIFCANNLRMLGAAVVIRETSGRRTAAKGTGLLLDAYRHELIKKGDERVFVCPADPMFERLGDPEFVASYESIDPKSPEAAYVSYAVREAGSFLQTRAARGPEPLALCTFHEGGVNVMYDDGSVDFVKSEDLGLSPGDPIVLGPSSKSDLLRKFQPRR